MSTIYLNRDNKLRYQIQVDGQTVTENAITRAKMALAGNAADDPADQIFDTNDAGSVAVLTDNATVLEIDAGERNLKTGNWLAYITVYDSANPDGLAASSVVVTVQDWLPDES